MQSPERSVEADRCERWRERDRHQRRPRSCSRRSGGVAGGAALYNHLGDLLILAGATSWRLPTPGLAATAPRGPRLLITVDRDPQIGSPDLAQVPAPSAAAVVTAHGGVTYEKFQTLGQLAVSLHREAEACGEHGLWHGALILLGSSIEAALLATAAFEYQALAQAGALPFPKKPLAEYPLAKLVELARRTEWLAPARNHLLDVIQETIEADPLTILIDVRNAAAHPGRYVSKLEELGIDFNNAEGMGQLYGMCRDITSAVFEKLATVTERWVSSPA